MSASLYDPQTEHDACGVGFVANIRGDKSAAIIQQALEVLRRLAHRGATGADPDTGDGAGILFQLPHRFFKREGLRLGFDMPRRRRYAVGMVFLPAEPEARARCEKILEEVVLAEGQKVIGWRDVPIVPEKCGRVARDVLPAIRQIYIQRRRQVPSAFERKLYVIRKIAENKVQQSGGDPLGRFHIASLSADTICYKGLLLPGQLPEFFPDLSDPDMVSALALVHSRFSTNTFPTWDLAQPRHYIAHNGEINTVRGNRNWMQARKSLLESAKFFGKLDRLFPIIVPGKSDSAQFDNMLELLHLGGRTLPHAMMMMIPEATDGARDMDEERKSYYSYSARLMEPWDGPAAIVFTDGELVGATLDRNGLRPARYVITEDDLVVLASEVGVIDIPPERIRQKGRLKPGRMFVVDTAEGRVIDDDEIKKEVAGRWPYRRWLQQNVVQFEQIEDSQPPAPMAEAELVTLQRAAGYTMEDVRMVLGPMVESGKEPLGSMGTDTPLAVLSDQAPPLSHYFHQLFAQVTNPPIDPLRERQVMSLETFLGPDGNSFEETPEQCHALHIPGPVITSHDLAKIAQLQEGVFEPQVLSYLYDRAAGPEGLLPAVQKLCTDAEEAVNAGNNILIISDRGVNAERVAIPALLALSAVHQHLVKTGTRMQTGLLVETAEAHSVHDLALLLGYGASAVVPYLALETVERLVGDGAVAVKNGKTPAKAYIEAIDAGLLKVMAKSGISTLQSYRGAQIFEVVGIDSEVVDRFFAGTPSRLRGIGMSELGREVLERHERAFGAAARALVDPLPVGGRLQWRRRGEHHKWNPATIAGLQAAVKQNSKQAFAEYSRLVDDEEEFPSSLSGLLAFKGGGQAISVDAVEPASDIVKRFVTGAMSFGSISAEAHETLAIAMNRLGGKSNTGEGGEEERRFIPDENGDRRSSAIKQIASGRFGVTPDYLIHSDEIQIKIAQGAKPGEGGELPGAKVDERIARVRCSTPGVTLISPPPHHDIYSIEDLAQLIYDLRALHPAARISVKLVSEVGIGTVAAGVAKAGADAIIIAGMGGGTGAATISSIKHAGLPWELGLAEAQQVLVQNRLRDRVRLQVNGGMRSARDVLLAALMGAEEFGMATAPLIAMGCIMLRKCHLNTCSVGIATQDERLRELFTGVPEDVVTFFMLLAEDLRAQMAALGLARLDDAVGRVDLLSARKDLSHWKAKRLDLSQLLFVPEGPAEAKKRSSKPRPLPSPPGFDREVLAQAGPAIDEGKPVIIELPIRNTDRAAGAYLSGEIIRRVGAVGLPADSITVRATGSAGQSFGAFLAPGVNLYLEGDTNDYLGKGMAGGRMAIFPPKNSKFIAHDNVIAGNVALYGATGGEAYLAGVAGERFAVQNSGARAVVEGLGDHGCEYMTGGVVVVLGPTGQNFGAGMSGGVAYLFEHAQRAARRANLETIALESLADDAEMFLVYNMIENHVRYTDSELGNRILDNWELMRPQFVKVMPVEYKRVLEERRSKRRARNSPEHLTVLAGGKGGNNG